MQQEEAEDIFSESGPWVCTTCTVRNSGDSLFCECCNARSHRLDVSYSQLRLVALDYGYGYIGSFKDLDVVPKQNRGEFSFAPTFHPDLIVALVKRGCFPMTTSVSRIPIMAVKLHHERSIVDLRFVAPHIQKKTRKISNRFSCSLNANDGSFERALEMINRRHPTNWLSPMLAQSLQRIQSPEMRMLVWEVFNADKNLVAVEIGYVHGKIYTSMTGAYEEDGAGSVQLATTAGWLLHHDFLVWDFGMQMEYKRGLGARTVPRNLWLEYVAALGGAVKIEPPKEAFECAVFARTKKSRCNFETLSVGELKHTAKLLNLDLRGLVEKSEMVEAVKKKLME